MQLLTKAPQGVVQFEQIVLGFAVPVVACGLAADGFDQHPLGDAVLLTPGQWEEGVNSWRAGKRVSFDLALPGVAALSPIQPESAHAIVEDSAGGQ